MFTIRKRAPAATTTSETTTSPTIRKLAGILRTPGGSTSSCSPDIRSAKKARRSVGFVDTIGKPLVEYRNLPDADDNDDGDDGGGGDDNNNAFSNNADKKLSGRCIAHVFRPDRVKWRLLAVKTAKPIREGPSETGIQEAQRLDMMGISRAPLFGTFSTIDVPELSEDAMLRACAPVRSIPTEVACLFATAPPATSAQIYVAEPTSSSSSSSLSSSAAASSESAVTSSNVLALMARLKERGLIKSEEHPPVLPAVISASEPTTMKKNKKKEKHQMTSTSSKWSTPSDEVCTFFVTRPNGCKRGDQCAFQHDVVMRERHQKEAVKRGWHRNNRNLSSRRAHKK